MLKSTGKRYIIQAESIQTTTAGGIIVNNTGEAQFARIKAIGPKILDPLQLEDRVLVDWNATIPLRDGDETYHLVDERAVIAVWEEK